VTRLEVLDIVGEGNVVAVLGSVDELLSECGLVATVANVERPRVAMDLGALVREMARLGLRRASRVS
jgi:hypothetical protein